MLTGSILHHFPFSCYYIPPQNVPQGYLRALNVNSFYKAIRNPFNFAEYRRLVEYDFQLVLVFHMCSLTEPSCQQTLTCDTISSPLAWEHWRTLPIPETAEQLSVMDPKQHQYDHHQEYHGTL
jgi:hypothetical protein